MRKIFLLTILICCLTVQAFALTKEQYYESGLLKMNRGRYVSAIADFTQAINQDLVYVDAYLKRAAAYNREGSNDRAIFDYNKVLFIDAHNL